MSLFEQLLENASNRHMERLTAWAEWKAKQAPPDPEEGGKRDQPVVWRRRPDVREGSDFWTPHQTVVVRPQEHWNDVRFSSSNSEGLAKRLSVNGADVTYVLPHDVWWQTYYEDIEWTQETIDTFPNFFELRRKATCETCPALGKLTMHHKRRSTKQEEIGGLLATFQFKHQAVDERVLMSEMKKGVWLCRDCHDRVHNAEKKLKNDKAFAVYIENLRHQEAAWLDVERIKYLAQLAPT